MHYKYYCFLKVKKGVDLGKIFYCASSALNVLKFLKSMMKHMLNWKLLFNICPPVSLVRGLQGFHYCHRSYVRFDPPERKGYEVDTRNSFVISRREFVM